VPAEIAADRERLRALLSGALAHASSLAPKPKKPVAAKKKATAATARKTAPAKKALVRKTAPSKKAPARKAEPAKKGEARKSSPKKKRSR